MGANALNLTPLAAAFAGLTLVLASPAAANDNVTLTFAAVKAADGVGTAKLLVTGTQGRYDRIGGAPLSQSLRLSAVVTADGAGQKIVASEVFLKQDGSGQGANSVKALSGTAPVRSLELTGDFDFAIESNGVIAQNAIALCNGRPASDRSGAETRTMSVPVVWRVTTGRFNFKWTNYDRVAPTEEIQNNPDFYGSRETAEAEASAEVAVVCEPIGRAIALKPAVAKSVTLEPKIETAPVQRLAAEPIATKAAEPPLETPAAPVAAPAVKTVSLERTTGRPACNGGMIREAGSSNESYLCLCPGNTQRVATGTNAFSCERK